MPKNRCRTNRANQITCIGQIEWTKFWGWARLNRHKIVYGPESTDCELSTGQTKNTFWARPNRLKFGYRLDRINTCSRTNRPNLVMVYKNGGTQNLFWLMFYKNSSNPRAKSSQYSNISVCSIVDVMFPLLSAKY